MDKKDNRTVERYPMKVPVTVNNSEGTVKYSEYETRDVSSGGVFIESKDINLSAGSRVQVELTLTVDKLKELFELSNKVLLKAEGTVARATEQGIAVKFSSNYSIKSLDAGTI